MATKRIIGVITVQDNLAVQSFGYNVYLPLGCPRLLAENLDRWEADEILILDISASTNGLGPNLSLLQSLKDINLSTPLIYGGGIRNRADAKAVIQSGADRIVIESLAYTAHSEASSISLELGRQAIIRSICVIENDGIQYLYDYKTHRYRPLTGDLFAENYDSSFYSELMVVDVNSDGENGLFNSNLLHSFTSINNIIAYGGVGTSSKAAEILHFDNVSAVAVGNPLHYAEANIYKMKRYINSYLLREPSIVPSCND